LQDLEPPWQMCQFVKWNKNSTDTTGTINKHPFIKKMESLPTEILLHIIRYLDKASIINLEQVCLRFSSVIAHLARHVWPSELLQLAKDDPALAHKFLKHGIGNDLMEKLQSCTIEEQDFLFERVRHLYKTVAGIEQRWKNCDPPPPTTLNLKSTRNDHIERGDVVNFEFYQDKVFVAYESEKLEAFSTSGDFSKIKVLKDDSHHFLQNYFPMPQVMFSMSGNTILHRNGRTNQLEVWNADTHEQIGKLSVPRNLYLEGHDHVGITGLGINRKAIVGLVESVILDSCTCNICVWPHDFSPGFEDRAPFVIRVPGHYIQIRESGSFLQMNETYLVTAVASSSIYSDEDDTDQILQHRFDDEEAILSKEFVSITPANKVELKSLCLSKDKLLAYQQCELNCPVMLHIKDVTNNVSIFNGPMPGVSDLPVAWVNQTLFLETGQEWHHHAKSEHAGYEDKLWCFDVGEQKFTTMPITISMRIQWRGHIKVEKTRICYAINGHQMIEDDGAMSFYRHLYCLNICDLWNACESPANNPKEEKSEMEEEERKSKG